MNHYEDINKIGNIILEVLRSFSKKLNIAIVLFRNFIIILKLLVKNRNCLFVVPFKVQIISIIKSIVCFSLST